MINFDVEDVREWLRQYVGSGWPVLSHDEHRYHDPFNPNHSIGAGAIALGHLVDIDNASPQQLTEMANELGICDQMINDLMKEGKYTYD